MDKLTYGEEVSYRIGKAILHPALGRSMEGLLEGDQVFSPQEGSEVRRFRLKTVTVLPPGTDT